MQKAGAPWALRLTHLYTFLKSIPLQNGPGPQGGSKLIFDLFESVQVSEVRSVGLQDHCRWQTRGIHSYHFKLHIRVISILTDFIPLSVMTLSSRKYFELYKRNHCVSHYYHYYYTFAARINWTHSYVAYSWNLRSVDSFKGGKYRTYCGPMLCWLVYTKHFFQWTRLFACVGAQKSHPNELTSKIQLCFQTLQYQKIPILHPDSSKSVTLNGCGFFCFLNTSISQSNVIYRWVLPNLKDHFYWKK